MRISFDMDGVLADYTTAFSTIGNEMFGLSIVGEKEIQHWNWEKWWSTKAQLKAIWKEVRKRETFWMDLEKIVSDEEAKRIARLMHTERVYFITSRPDTGGVDAQYQSARWVQWTICKDQRVGSRPSPSVLVSSKKGRLCEALDIQYHIDDKFTYCIDIVKNSPKTRVFMMETMHNKWMPEQFPNYFEKRGSNRAEITVIHSVTEFLDAIGAS